MTRLTKAQSHHTNRAKDDVPGLAHFCEHMLSKVLGQFIIVLERARSDLKLKGSVPYPAENDFLSVGQI